MSIQSTGIGSGLDVNSLVSKLMQVESQPLTSLAKKQTSYQAKLSAYGTLNSALGSFQSAVANLSNPSVFQSLTATSGDSTIASATAAVSAAAGTYSITVNQLAQNQSISSAGQVSSSDAIGTGTSTTVSFQFGTIAGTAVNGTYPSGATFTQDTTQTTGTVTIDSSNNSLQGIRDAINSAGIGVNASIVGDGSATPYHLVLSSAKTGATSSLQISATGDSAVANLLNYNPSGTQNFTEISTAQNASLKVNGINITSAANTVTSAVQGVTLNLTKAGTTSISVTTNSGAVQNSVTNFVQAYNALNATITSLTSYNSSTQKGGLLLGDSTTQGVQNQIRNSLSAAVNGLGGGLTTLSQIGVSFQKDGSLSVDSTKLSKALTNNFSDVGGLFASIGKTSDSLTSIAGSTSATKEGTYALNVTQIATQGSLTGSLALPGTTTIDANTTLNVTLNNLNASVAIPSGSYTPAQLATAVQTAINTTSAFSAVGSSVKASINSSGQLVLQSTSYGSSSNVTLADGTGTSASSLAGTQLNGTAGVDVAGTLNGTQVSGSGQTLTGAVGTNTEGLKILVAGGSVGARGTVNYSIGYASKLTTLLNGFLGSSGTIASTTDGVNRTLKDLSKQTDTLNSRLIDVEARYRAQFTALDSIISSLNSTSTFLTQQLSALTGSSK